MQFHGERTLQTIPHDVHMEIKEDEFDNRQQTPAIIEKEAWIAK